MVTLVVPRDLGSCWRDDEVARSRHGCPRILLTGRAVHFPIRRNLNDLDIGPSIGQKRLPGRGFRRFGGCWCDVLLYDDLLHRRVSVDEFLLGHGESFDFRDGLAEFREGDTMLRVDAEDPFEELVGLNRYREDFAKEVGVGDVSAERFVSEGSLLPGISATCEVDEDNAKGPDVVSPGRVGCFCVDAALTFGTHVET